jgi:hypothetical protein
VLIFNYVPSSIDSGLLPLLSALLGRGCGIAPPHLLASIVICDRRPWLLFGGKRSYECLGELGGAVT